MPLAFLQASFGKPVIDSENGIITGVKIMEVGKTAHFKDTAGTTRSVKITPAHIKALMGHAGNRSLPVHYTHEWISHEGKPDADSKEMDSRIGALKNFRKDDAGDLIADAIFKAGQKRDDIMWSAEHNPEDVMFSAVFNFSKDDPQCIPTNFRAGDIVPQGAATTALFSETQTQPMDIKELLAMLDDPQCKDAIKAIVKSHQDPGAEMQDSAAAEMESDAGVTDADKKKEDDQKPALMRAALRCNRATVRLAKSLAVDKTALLAEVKTASAAEATALLGKAPFLQNGVNVEVRDKYTATLTRYKETAPSATHAVARMLKDHPELSEAHEAATRERCEKLASKS